MYCKKCNEFYPDNLPSCPNCGQPAGGVQPPEKRMNKALTVLVSVLAGAVIVVAIALLLVYTHQNHSQQSKLSETTAAAKETTQTATEENTPTVNALVPLTTVAPTTKPRATLPPATVAPAVSSTRYCTLCQEYVTLRSEPSHSASAMTRVPKNASVGFVSELQNSEYIKVVYNGQTGYVMKAYFTETANPGSRQLLYCRARESCSLRSKPGSDNTTKITSIMRGDAVQATGVSKSVNEQLYQEVLFKGYRGYVLAAVFNTDPNGPTYTGN